jgi:hypothetical protein
MQSMTKLLNKFIKSVSVLVQWPMGRHSGKYQDAGVST